MEVYQQIMSSLPFIDSGSLLWEQILTMLGLCKEYWQIHEQYKRLDRAQKILRPLYDNKNEEIDVISLEDRLYLTFFIKLRKKGSTKQLKEYDLLTDSSVAQAGTIIRDRLHENCTELKDSDIDGLTDKIKISYDEFLNKEADIRDISCKSALMAYDLIKENRSASEIALEKCVNSVLSKEFGDCVEECIKHGNEKDQLALYLLIAPCRRAMIDGELYRYTCPSDSRKGKDKVILPWLNPECYRSLAEISSRIAEILNSEYLSESCKMIKEYIDLCNCYYLEI